MSLVFVIFSICLAADVYAFASDGVLQSMKGSEAKPSISSGFVQVAGTTKPKSPPVSDDDDGVVQTEPIHGQIEPAQTAVQPSPPQSNTDQAVQLLVAAFATALPPTTTNNAGVTYRELTTLKFYGDAKIFAVSFVTSRRTHVISTNSVTSEEEKRVVRADFSRLEKVTTDGRSLSLDCAEHQRCIDFIISRAGDVSLDLADAETADNAKFAIDYLIQTNRSTAGVSR